MIPDSKIETTSVFWDTSPKSPGGTLEKELIPFRRQSQPNALPKELQSILSEF